VKVNPNLANMTPEDNAKYPDVCGYNNGADPRFPDGQPWMCQYLKELPVHGTTFNWSAFVQDSWSILPNLTVNAGLRYEQQYLGFSQEIQDTIDPVTGNSIGSNALELKSLIAPRIGLIYDWTKEGRSKVYGNWGRFYESIPMDINLRSFGGEQTYDSYWTWSDTSLGGGPASQCGNFTPTDPNDPRLPSLPQNCPQQPSADGSLTPDGGDAQFGFGSPAYGIPPGVTLVMPGIKPQYMDEIVLGVEYEVLEDLRLGVSFQNRRLGRVIEDMSTDGAVTYFLANPGEFDSDEEAKMVSQIAAMPAGMTKDQLQARLDAFRQVRKFDKPTRDYNAVQLTAAKRFSRAFMVQGSYTYSQLKGNYPGLFSPDTGQLDPNITSQYDLIELLANRYGSLPADRPHSFKLDGYYTFDLAKAGRITAGARFRGQSGSPINTLGRHPLYGRMESYLIPRGTNGRTDFQANADLHFAYGRKIGNMDLEVYFELFNIFNTQEQTGVDAEYTQSRSNPISGGTVEDLPYLQLLASGAGTGNLVTKKLNYKNTTARAAALAGRLGVTLTF